MLKQAIASYPAATALSRHATITSARVDPRRPPAIFRRFAAPGPAPRPKAPVAELVHALTQNRVPQGVLVRFRPGHQDLSKSLRICYVAHMANQTKSIGRRTTMVPVTTMEEIPVLSDRERAELTTSLKEAEARINAGKAVDYEPKTFKDRLLAIYRRGKR